MFIAVFKDEVLKTFEIKSFKGCVYQIVLYSIFLIPFLFLAYHVLCVNRVPTFLSYENERPRITYNM